MDPAVEERVAEFVDSLLACRNNIAQEPKPDEIPKIAIFMHGVAIRCYLRRILGGSTTAAIHLHSDNVSISELLYKATGKDTSGWNIVRVNDSFHLNDVPKEEPKKVS